MLLSFLQGLCSALRIQESPLYRYPYRNAAEAFRGDTKRISEDVEHCMEHYRE